MFFTAAKNIMFQTTICNGVAVTEPNKLLYNWGIPFIPVLPVFGRTRGEQEGQERRFKNRNKAGWNL